MKRAFPLLLLALLIFCAKLARADILFIDLNDAPEEIAAARKAAAERGEKLIVFPQRTPQQQLLLNQIHQLELKKDRILGPAVNDWRLMDDARRQLVALERSGKATPSQTRDLSARMNLYEKKMGSDYARIKPQVDAVSAQEATLHNKVWFDPDQLQSIIKTSQVETIIISGHHDYNEYTGALGSMTQDQLSGMIQEAPAVQRNIKSVYGWGCYSADPAEHDYWKRMLPHLELLGGFDAGSSSSARPVDSEFLEGILEREAAIRKIGDDEKTAHDAKLILKVARAIPGFDLVNGALCTRAVCVGMNTGALDLSKQTSICTLDAYDDLSRQTLRYNADFLAANANCESIPCSTLNSWLRSFYNDVRAHQHCGIEPNLLQSQFAAITTAGDAIIRLIDFREIYENFKTFYHEDIARLQMIEQACGMSDLLDVSGEVKCTPPPGQDPNQKTESRAQIVAFIDQLNKQSNDCVNSGTLSDEDAQFLSRMVRRYGMMIDDLKCIPLGWVNAPLGGRLPQAPDPACIGE